MSDVEESFDENDSTVSPKKGKKTYYPFGTPTHNSVPYSKFAHLNNAQTQEFATQLSSTSSSLLVREPQPERPKRNPTKKTPSKATSSADTPAPEVIPDAEGLEPCTKIACQQVIRTITELQFRNEVERDEIEDEYERLLQDLAGAEQEIAAAEAKLVTLNDIGSQLEMRSNQLQEKVESLQNTKDAQDTERNDINGKLMILQTEKNKRARGLDKAIKALSDATWRKKKKEQQDNADAGLSLPASEISEKPILHADASTVSSLGNIYKTSYNQLAGEWVRDTIELAPPVKTLPPYMVEKLAQPAEVKSLDKYAQRHYKKVMEHNVKSWEGMDGSLITASIYSASSRGYGPDVVAESFDQYNRIRASRGLSSSISTAASSRVGSILQGRTAGGGSVAGKASAGASVTSLSLDASMDQLSHLIRSRENSPAGSRRGRASHVSGKYHFQEKTKTTGRPGSNGQIRLAPISNSVAASQQPFKSSKSQANQVMGVGEIGFDNIDGAGGFGDDGFGEGALSVSQFSALSVDSHLQPGSSLSPHSLSMSLGLSDYNPFGESQSVSGARRLDPVFYKDKSRYHFARNHPVGKLRKVEVTWGMKAYVDPSKSNADTEDEDELATNASNKVSKAPNNGKARGFMSSSASIKSGANSRASTASRTFRDPFSAPAVEPTVKSRSLTVYHPDMQIFRDAASLPKKKTAE